MSHPNDELRSVIRSFFEELRREMNDDLSGLLGELAKPDRSPLARLHEGDRVQRPSYGMAGRTTPDWERQWRNQSRFWPASIFFG